MLKNYIIVTIRNLAKHKGYSAINIAGLAIGMACFLLIMLYVQNELSYDKFHEHSDRIYRVVPDLDTPEGPRELAQSSPPLAPALVAVFPEVIKAVRFVRTRSLIAFGEKQFYENDIFYCDETVFDIFTYPLLAGNHETALQEPNSIVITRELAQKYFGDTDPMGLLLEVNNERAYKVTGVLSDIPRHTHFPFDGLVSYKTLETIGPEWINLWGAFFYQTYILTGQGFNPEAFEAKLPEFLTAAIGEETFMTLHLQPLTDIYLNSHRRGEVGTRGNAMLIYLFAGTAFFILAIASINFMNLATARSVERAKEIAMRKVIGARRQQLARQFIGESVIVSTITTFLAVALSQLLLPFFNMLADEEIPFDLFGNIAMLAVFMFMPIAVGVIAGSYPALVLSKLGPARVFKGAFKGTTSGHRLRNGLVVFQFALSIVLMVGTTVVLRQVDFLKSQNLGFDGEQMLVVDFKGDRAVLAKAGTIKNELLRRPEIRRTALSSRVPGTGTTYNYTVVIDEGDSLDLFFGVYAIDYDFMENYGIELLDGRSFSELLKADAAESAMINEASLSKLGWTRTDQAIGKRIILDGEERRIIGVVKNFNYKSLHEEIEPLCMIVRPEDYRYLSVRFDTADFFGLVADLKTKWRELVPLQPFEYFFLDEHLDAQYRAEERFGQIFGVSSGMAVFIAGLGLLGLAALASQQKTKEIGIRKVLGASTSSIVAMLSGEFVRLVLLANLIAWPMAYFLMRLWLQNFVYRSQMDWWVFGLAGGLALIIALLTVSIQAIKAATANPVKCLRYE